MAIAALHSSLGCTICCFSDSPKRLDSLLGRGLEVLWRPVAPGGCGVRAAQRAEVVVPRCRCPRRQPWRCGAEAPQPSQPCAPVAAGSRQGWHRGRCPAGTAGLGVSRSGGAGPAGQHRCQRPPGNLLCRQNASQQALESAWEGR